ncbi:hypothetical protein KP509_25G052500 [Ceratopteris richardii]|uniref:Cytosol aminopeptidase domain-containing protein n=1 Tax=Ceratopteris richardii TaxID=49495 RepID=A0A8T2RT72_CERRI|nr:hypothetical protein KP509_25G052500 [Ceratopteris richardii]KAH7298643.1 hypothetical protein KP509_25G052500 [Ceratopteris richardii]
MEHSLGLTSPLESILPKVKISAKEIDFNEWKGDTLAIGVSSADLDKDEETVFKNSNLRTINKIVNGTLASVILEEDFTGKAGQSVALRLVGLGFKRLVLVGCETSTVLSSVKWKNFGESVATATKSAQPYTLGVTLADFGNLSDDQLQQRAHSLVTGIILGTYEDSRFKSERKKVFLETLDLIGFGTGEELEKKLTKTQNLCLGIFFSRELVNAPANVLTPAKLAAEASQLCVGFEDVLSAQVFDECKCRELKMGAYLGVAAASSNPPRFIHLQYKPPKGTANTKLAIVGKGLTFDSGGYNLKVGGASIELMKFDMGGAAAAFGAAKAIAAIRPLGVEVHFIVAACENMISGAGMRPGDIVTASNGKTIEVNNTDAEGRLTLADALVYTCKQGVHKIVDLATLTGACVVALGNDIAGMFTLNDDLAKELVESSERAGEKLWRMPMEENYWEAMKSSVADMVNTGGRPGGSITASLFLKQVPQLHLDVGLDLVVKCLLTC